MRETEVLRLLGLATRAGHVVPGSDRVREAARSGELRFAVVAADASTYRRDRLLPLLAGLSVPHVLGFDRQRLGQAVGRAPLGAVGVTSADFASRLAVLAGLSDAVPSRSDIRE